MTTLLKSRAPAPAVYLPNDLRPSLMGLSREDLAQILGRVGVPEKQRRMRSRQIWHWIYHRGATSFAEMTEKMSQEILERSAAAAQARNVPSSGRSLVNDLPYEGIIETASSEGCDLIFMASHGRRGLVGLLLGSETQKVLTNTLLPVLVVR